MLLTKKIRMETTWNTRHRLWNFSIKGRFIRFYLLYTKKTRKPLTWLFFSNCSVIINKRNGSLNNKKRRGGFVGHISDRFGSYESNKKWKAPCDQYKVAAFRRICLFEPQRISDHSPTFNGIRIRHYSATISFSLG